LPSSILAAEPDASTATSTPPPPVNVTSAYLHQWQNISVGRLLTLLLLVSAALPAADTLLILHKLDDSFGFYDPSTGKLEAKVATGRKPHEFALSVDQRLAFITNYGADTYTETQPGGNTLTIVDLQQRKAIGEIDLGEYRRPHGIERGKSGLFYVTTDFPAALLIVDGRKRKIVHAIKLSNKLPHMVQVSPDERKAWTADAGSGTVSIIDLANRRQMASVEVGGVPMGLALDGPAKNLFVATRTGNMVVVVDAVANRVKRSVGIPGMPARVVLSPDGKLLFTSLIDSGELAAINTRTQLEIKRVPAGARSEGLYVEPSGEFLYISAQSENKVKKFSIPDLELVQTIDTPPKPDPIYLLRSARP